MSNKMQEWCWFDGAGVPRSKVRYVDPRTIDSWSADGSSMFGTDMKPMSRVNDSDVSLEPLHVMPVHPTLPGAALILATTGTPAMDMHNPDALWIGYEQELYLVPLNTEGNYMSDNAHYCGIGASAGRDIMIEHAKTCVEHDLGYYGWNSEVSGGQWEWQMDPLSPYEASLDLQLSRIIMCLVAEKYGYYASYEPVLSGYAELSGSGLHANVSTRESRERNGGAEWLAEKLMTAYDADPIPLDGPIFGVGNLDRLSAGGEAPDPYQPSYGIADRSGWIRMPRGTDDYCEIRLPGANADPFALGRWVQGLLEGSK